MLQFLIDTQYMRDNVTVLDMQIYVQVNVTVLDVQDEAVIVTIFDTR